MERRRNEAVAERVHLHQRREPHGVAEIVDVFSLGQARAGRRLDGDDADLLLLAAELVGGEGEGEAGEVGATAGAADDDVRLVVRLLELFLRFEADDRLMGQHVVEHAAQRILRVLARGRVLHRLADGDAEAARRVRIFCQNFLACLSVGTGTGDDLSAPRLHHDAAVGLLLIRDLDHVDLALQAKEVARHRQRRAPLTGARLGADARDLLLLVVVRLGHRGVRLVAAGGTHALVLVVNVGRRAERLLESARAEERRRPPEAQDVPHFFRDLDPALLTDFLLDQLHREERRQVLRPDRLAGAGMKHGRERRLQIGLDVVPLRRNVLLVEEEFGAVLVGWRHAGLLRGAHDST